MYAKVRFPLMLLAVVVIVGGKTAREITRYIGTPYIPTRTRTAPYQADIQAIKFRDESLLNVQGL
jgi:hypothetical protein